MGGAAVKVVERFRDKHGVRTASPGEQVSLIPIDPAVAREISTRARSETTSPAELIDGWLREKLRESTRRPKRPPARPKADRA